MEKSERSEKIKRFFDNWHRFQIENPEYAEAYFMGAWCWMCDVEAAEVLSWMTKKDFDLILSYPIWM